MLPAVCVVLALWRLTWLPAELVEFPRGLVELVGFHHKQAELVGFPHRPAELVRFPHGLAELVPASFVPVLRVAASKIAYLGP